MAGRKTCTRRIVKFLPGKNPNWTGYIKDDGKGIIKGVVTKIEDDHFILENEDGIHLWVDFEENRDESVTMKAFSNQEDAVSFIN